MNILADNPVFQREARWGRRLRRLRHNRPLAVMVAIIALAIVWLYWQGLNFYVSPQIHYNYSYLWRLCSSVYLLLLVLLAPAITSSAISHEREQQTWETLMATQLTAPEILIGKWLARLIPIGWISLLLAPLLLISATAGLDLSALPGVLLFLAITAALYSVLGLLCSFIARKTIVATTVSLVVTALLCVGTWVIHLLLFSGDYWNLYDTSGYVDSPSPLWINPFFLLSVLSVPPGHSQPENSGTVISTYWIISLITITVCFNLLGCNSPVLAPSPVLDSSALSGVETL